MDQPASYDILINALHALGNESLHPELATVPILFVGHSMGGCTAYVSAVSTGTAWPASSP